MTRARMIVTVALVTLVGLSLGASFAHVLELPAKMSLDAAHYRTVQGIYGMFGPTAAFLEPASILGVVALATATRGHAAFRYFVVAAGLLVAALLTWTVLVSPMNTLMKEWGSAMPASWTDVRARWEWGHVVGFIIKLGAFIVLAAGAVVDGGARHEHRN